MDSIYRTVLGTDFEKLHPRIQKRFGFNSLSGITSIGRGVMDSVWYGRMYTLPFLYIGTWRNIMFPQKGTNVPFTIENYAYLDQFGRETVTWIRTYDFGNQRRRFDATMIYSCQRNRIVDYIGTHQHLAVDIDLTVDEEGGLRLRSGEQRFYEGIIGFRFPMRFSGVADVREWYDETMDKYRIDVKVTNDHWGPLFGYHGSFDTAFIPIKVGGIPAYIKPVREEKRE